MLGESVKLGSRMEALMGFVIRALASVGEKGGRDGDHVERLGGTYSTRCGDSA